MEKLSIREDLANLLTDAVTRAQAKGLIPPISAPISPVDRAANPAHGDYASTLPLKLARAASMSPRQIAQAIVSELAESPMVGEVTIAGPGFVNFRLRDSWLAEKVGAVVEAGESFGSIDIGHGSTVQVEFVSANPTGPLPAAAGRGGSLGDSLARVLSAAGFQVQREYYVNDHGSRVDVLGQSLYARYLQLFGREVEFPPDGYHGEYVTDLARQLKESDGERYLSLSLSDAGIVLGRLAMSSFLEAIKSDLDRLGITYDCWFSESSLYEHGDVDKTLESLRERGYVAEREGAVWLSSTNLGEDKDNVLVRTSGEPTYFASDIAYHKNKLVDRGFDRVIDVWGADHQGHVSRTKTAVGALGINSDRLQIIIHQLVTLKVGGQSVRMGKRSGNVVFLRDVLDDVGADACRFFFVSRSADSHLDFDLDLAKKQTDDNPVYYVQYAHARTAGILRLAAARGLTTTGADLTLLQHPAELALIRKMIELPELVELAATNLEPHHLPHYALDLANVFHSFYTQCIVLTDDIPLTTARLTLVLAAKYTLRNTLALIGVTAPEEMERRERGSDQSQSLTTA